MPSIPEIIAVFAPKIQVLTDASTTVWDMKKGVCAQWTPGGNNNLSITNLRGSGFATFGSIDIIQDSTGNRLPALPGDTKGVSWQFAPGSVNVLDFKYNGTAFYWSSKYVTDIEYGSQLSVPGSFTATPVSGSEIDLTWSAPSDANQYQMDMTTDPTFATGVSTIFTGSALLYNKTGLTPGTTYYFRIKAQDTTGTFRDSAYTTTNATTTGGLVPLTFSVFTQSPTGTWNTATSPNWDVASQVLTGAGKVYAKINGSTTEVVVIGVDDSATRTNLVDGSSHANWVCALYPGSGGAGAHYFAYCRGENSGNVIDTGVAWADHDLYGTARDGSNNLLLVKSSDLGVTWTTVHTVVATPAGSLSPKSYISNSSNHLYQPLMG